MRIRYDSEADAVYIQLREPVGKIVGTDFIDVSRYVDYDEDDNVVGIEILDVSLGLDLTGLPEADRAAEALQLLQPRSPAPASEESLTA